MAGISEKIEYQVSTYKSFQRHSSGRGETEREVSKYNLWRIGITNDPDRRQREHALTEDVWYWKHWNTGSSLHASCLELLFQIKGMRGGTGGGNDDSTYVYIF